MANGTKFVEFKEELLPKIITAVIDSIWYPKNEEEEPVDPDTEGDDGEEGQD